MKIILVFYMLLSITGCANNVDFLFAKSEPVNCSSPAKANLKETVEDCNEKSAAEIQTLGEKLRASNKALHDANAAAEPVTRIEMMKDK